MRLTVLGSYGPYPAAGGACSGYLLEHEGWLVLLECGSGVLSRLQNYRAPWELEAVLVSHLHGDHIADLLIMRYALDLAQNRGVTEKRLDVYTPEEPGEERSRIYFKNAYNLQLLREGERMLELGPYRFSFLPVKHPLPTMAIKVECGGKILVYSGDTEYFPELINFTKGADLFLCEANFLEEDIKAGAGNHLSAAQAADIAVQGGVKRLALTHFAAFRDQELYRKEADEVFKGVEMAYEGTVWEI